MTADVADVFTEPDADPNTLSNLGPLATLAGTWEGADGTDEHPVREGLEVDAFVERYDLQPIDPQTNGPQLFYGLRYHRHIVKPGEIETFHDQVGYWLWEPATHAVLLTIAIPRGQVALASGWAEPDGTTFQLSAREGLETFGICSNPFLLDAFRTLSFTTTVTVQGPEAWCYDEITMLQVKGTDEPFSHRDRNTLVRIAPPRPNPLAEVSEPVPASGPGAGLGIGSLGDTP